MQKGSFFYPEELPFFALKTKRLFHWKRYSKIKEQIVRKYSAYRNK